MRILLLMMDFSNWEQARPWSYSPQFGVEEGLLSHGVQVATIPAIRNFPSADRRSWLAHLPRLLQGERFDQVWLWLGHQEFDERFWGWFREVAPVRVGFVVESLTYDEKLYEIDPRLKARAGFVLSQLQHCTHSLVVDEADEPLVQSNLKIPAIFWPGAVPQRSILPPSDPKFQRASFFGVPYLWRELYLRHQQLMQEMVAPPPPETSTDLPRRFDQLQVSQATFLAHSVPTDGHYIKFFTDQHRAIRRGIHDIWVKGLSEYLATVNLPSMGKHLGARITESMAAGRPVISWRIPGRPKTMALFEEGKEILLYDPTKPEELLEQILKLKRDAALYNSLIAAAREKVAREHTAEVRTGQVLRWLNG